MTACRCMWNRPAGARMGWHADDCPVGRRRYRQQGGPGPAEVQLMQIVGDARGNDVAFGLLDQLMHEVADQLRAAGYTEAGDFVDPGVGAAPAG